MMRSLYAGVQGLRAHQIRMDVIGNNIANVNTTGFKASRVSFSDAFSQSLAGAAAPGTDRGGINPRQIGLGVNVASIDTLMGEGSMELTGNTTDMAIVGKGFFVVRDGGRRLYTRAGTFDFDSQGYLVNPATGQRVQGWNQTNGTFPARNEATMGDIQVPVTDSVLAKATATVTFAESLNALAQSAIDTAGPPVVAAPPTFSTPFKVIDSLGVEHILTVNMYKTANNRWDAEVMDGTTPLSLAGPTPAYTTVIPEDTDAHITGEIIQFNPDGSLMDPDLTDTEPANIVMKVTGYDPGGGADLMDFDLDFNRVIQPAIKGTGTTIAPSTLAMSDQDGYAAGALIGIDVDAAGVVHGVYSNNQSREVAQVALANFFNPGGLTKEGANNWSESANSGMALIGAAGEAGRGLIAPSTLEMSNVDIAAEFTNMIVTQRGFQANSKIITTSDEMLQEVVNLKR